MLIHTERFTNTTNNKLAIYTVIIGNYDELKTPMVIDKDCDYYCITTNTEIKSDVWKIIQITTDAEIGNIRTARYLKIHPHELFFEYEKSLFIDANYQINSSVWDFINEFSTGQPLLTFKHNLRSCIYEEAQACKADGKDFAYLIDRQIEVMRENDYPEQNGLVWSAIVYREHNNPLVIKVMDEWWKIINEGSRRDQLSFNYVCWKNNFDFDICPLPITDNNFFKYSKHNDETSEIKNLLFETLKVFTDETIIIYGAGQNCSFVLEYLQNSFPQANILLCDSNYKSITHTLPVISPEELLQNHLNSKIIISTSVYYHDVVDFLLKHKFSSRNIFAVYSKCSYDLYYTSMVNKLYKSKPVIDINWDAICSPTMQAFENLPQSKIVIDNNTNPEHTKSGDINILSGLGSTNKMLVIVQPNVSEENILQQ